MTKLPQMCWIVVDGLPKWLVDRQLSKNPTKFPTLARLMRTDQIARLLPVSPNCQTPPSLCSLFSGAGPGTHGLTGFDVPDANGPLATSNAFAAFQSDVPMIWDHYAKAGLSVSLCHIPFVDAHSLGEALVSHSYGFVPPTVAPFSIDISDGEGAHRVADLGLQVMTQRHPDGGVWIDVSGPSGSAPQKLHLKSGEWAPITIVSGAPTLACLCETDDGVQVHVLGSYSFTPTGQAPDQVGERFPFVAGGLAKVFRSGGFGRPLIDGGDGRAERVLFRGVSELSKRFWAEAVVAVAAQKADFILAYQPAYDLLFHEILGLVDPENAHSTPARALLADALLCDALAEIDCGLAAVVSAAGGRPCVMCSDHGMKPVDTILCPNVLLKDWGYLTTRAGQIDPDQSVAYFHPAETGAVWFAKTAKGDAPEAILDRLTQAFAEYTGRPCGWFATDVRPNAHDHFAQHRFFAPGVGQTLKAYLDGPAVRPSRKTADHATFTEDASLHGVVAALNHRATLPKCVAAQDVAQVFTREVHDVAH
ncbi:alkaline phosphatase family protein [Roseobacter weihaiensis]|uniref:alkaline phosphatase family protein n=1 Tax=Roseobacter weihaiensis TaxID=2763262 RepID=UPI001D0AA5FE|nr:alkaline phosphatase family protein [Roseobacter sp. H9]